MDNPNYTNWSDPPPIYTAVDPNPTGFYAASVQQAMNDAQMGAGRNYPLGQMSGVSLWRHWNKSVGFFCDISVTDCIGSWYFWQLPVQLMTLAVSIAHRPWFVTAPYLAHRQAHWYLTGTCITAAQLWRHLSNKNPTLVRYNEIARI